jgi:hypothetical protein
MGVSLRPSQLLGRVVLGEVDRVFGRWKPPAARQLITGGFRLFRYGRVVIIWPDDMDDPVDRYFVASIIEPHLDDDETVVVNAAMGIVHWTNGDGVRHWRVVSLTSEPPLSELVGLLEMSKFQMFETHRWQADESDDDDDGVGDVND